MLQNAPSAIIICLLAACGGAQAQPTLAPPAKHAEITACLDTLTEGAGWDVFAACTAELHTKPRCQAAWVEGAHAHATLSHIAEIANSCAAAYCAELPGSRPTLCDSKADAGSPIMAVYLAELETAILSRDAGLHDHPGLLGRFAATMLAVIPMQANDSGVQITLPTAKGIELSDATLVVSLLNDGTVTLDGNRISEGDLRKRFVAAHAENADTQVVIKADTSVAHGRVVTVMDTAKSAGISRLAISTKAEPTH